LFLKKKTSPVKSKKIESSKSDKQLHNAHLVREAWWLFLVLIGLYLIVILTSYNPVDYSWFYTKSVEAAIENSGGKVGAWISDMLLNLFGLSAWWWVCLAFYTIWLTYQRIEVIDEQRTFLIFNFAGFALLIVASSGLEAGHIVNLPASLPHKQGGILGHSVAGLFYNPLGFVSSTMLLFLLFAVGFSFFTGWSWIMIT